MRRIDHAFGDAVPFGLGNDGRIERIENQAALAFDELIVRQLRNFLQSLRVVQKNSQITDASHTGMEAGRRLSRFQAREAKDAFLALSCEPVEVGLLVRTRRHTGTPSTALLLIDQYDAVVSLACGVGVQFTAEQYPSTMIYPGVNTCFMGATEKRGLWTERCQGCGQCILATTGSICPVARCAKRLFNGPCGGSTTGKCEINAEVDCAWQLIVDRMKALDKLDQYETLCPIKDWSTDRAGGPRKVTREDVQQ